MIVIDTCIYGKRPISMKRDLFLHTESLPHTQAPIYTYIQKKLSTHIPTIIYLLKRPVSVYKETNIYM